MESWHLEGDPTAAHSCATRMSARKTWKHLTSTPSPGRTLQPTAWCGEAPWTNTSRQGKRSWWMQKQEEGPAERSATTLTYIYIWPPSIKFDHGSTSWLSYLFDCCSVACGCRDRCGRNNLCRKKIAFVCGVWSVRVVALLSAGPSSCFCIHQLLFPCLEVLVQGASPHHAVGCTV